MKNQKNNDLKFPIYFSKKIAFAENNKNSLSRFIILIGRFSVALGIIVSLITISTGIGSKKAIKNSLMDFSGEISVKSTRSNSSYNTSQLILSPDKIKKIQEIEGIAHLQKYITTNGIIRTNENFAGIIFKGVGSDFDSNRFKKYLIKGKIPTFKDQENLTEIIISQKIAQYLNKNINDSIITIFSKEEQKPIYRKFKIAGIYKTDIKIIDELYIIGNISHTRKILNMGNDTMGGLEIFLKDNAKEIDKNIIPKIENIIGYKNFIEKITDKFPQITDWINIFDTNIALIIIIMLLVVIINIIMLLLILIIERTQSIGLLKTLGATNQQIRSIFISYTLIILIPGLIIGNSIGILLLFIQKKWEIIKLNPENYYVSTVPVDLNWSYIVMVSVGILVISGISLILPSYIISKISPIKSIKYN